MKSSNRCETKKNFHNVSIFWVKLWFLVILNPSQVSIFSNAYHWAILTARNMRHFFIFILRIYTFSHVSVAFSHDSVTFSRGSCFQWSFISYMASINSVQRFVRLQCFLESLFNISSVECVIVWSARSFINWIVFSMNKC